MKKKASEVSSKRLIHMNGNRNNNNIDKSKNNYIENNCCRGTNPNNNDKINNITSIVISGWPAVGKTTMASEIAKEFNFKLYNGGDILKLLARDKGYSISGNEWWDTQEAKNFMDERKTDPHFDKEVDKKLVEIVKTEKAVITSYTLPWLVHQGPIKFWLKGSQLNRAKRMANRDMLSLAEAQKVIKMRDEQNKIIYRKLYGFDFGEDLTVFDFLINTDLMCLDSLVKLSIRIIENIIITTS
jgi:CMP/dCMP kinase